MPSVHQPLVKPEENDGRGILYTVSVYFIVFGIDNMILTLDMYYTDIQFSLSKQHNYFFNFPCCHSITIYI